MVFRGSVAKNLVNCGSAQNTQLLEGFLARTELSAKKETGVKLSRLASLAVRGFCFPSSPLSNSFFISSLEVSLIWTTPTMLPVFLRCYQML